MNPYVSEAQRRSLGAVLCPTGDAATTTAAAAAAADQTTTVFRPPPNMVPQPQPHLTGHPQYQQYYQHYQQQILRQQQQWQRNNFHQNQFTTPAVQPPPANAYNRAGGSTDPSNWNQNTATTAKVPQQLPPQLNTNLQQSKKKSKFWRSSQSSKVLLKVPQLPTWKLDPVKEGVSQQPAWIAKRE